MEVVYLTKQKPVFIWKAVEVGSGIYDVYVCWKYAFTHTFKNNSWGYTEQKAIEARAVGYYEEIYGSLSGSIAEAKRDITYYLQTRTLN